MKHEKSLARWATGENAFTALALASRLDVQSRPDVGISGRSLRDELAKGKSDVQLTLQCARLTNDEALLRKLARERRVSVRVTALSNPHTPFDVLDAVLVRDKNWDVRHAASEAVKRRVRSMPTAAAFEVLSYAKSEEVIEEIVQRAKLNDEDVHALLERSFQVPNRWGSERTVRAADHLAQRSDLKRFSDETVLAVAKETTLTVVVRHCVTAKRSSVLEDLLKIVEEGTLSAGRPADVLRELAWAKEMEPRYYRRVLAAASEHGRSVTSAIAENAHAPWELLEGEIAAHTPAAVGRALQAMFHDVAAVWLLAAKLMENTMTVREVLDVLCVTHPEHLRS